MDKKTAVVLFNLGGPDSLDAVRPFLRNLFSDPDIFRFPLAFITQRLFAELVSRRRAREAQKNYAAIGGRSPLLDFTKKQADALQQSLNSGQSASAYECVICMRYWHPLTRDVVTQLKNDGFQKIILLPLYPHYSITTTGSSYNEFRRQCQIQHYQPHIHLIHHWYQQPDYQQAIIDGITKASEQFPDPRPEAIELVFSAHGLPQKIIDAGDPYEQHIRATYESLIAKLGTRGWSNTSLCYQSRVGPLQWLQPYTEALISDKAEAGVQQMLVYPIAFVSDHVETLYELGMEYAQLANEKGIKHYRVVAALNDHPLLIKALSTLALRASNE